MAKKIGDHWLCSCSYLNTCVTPLKDAFWSLLLNVNAATLRSLADMTTANSRAHSRTSHTPIKQHTRLQEEIFPYT